MTQARAVIERFRVDDHEADVGRGLDLVLLCAVDVGHGKDQACFPVGPRLERSRPQPPGGLRRQHADADPFYDVPDALAVALLAHVDAPRFLRHRLLPREVPCSCFDGGLGLVA